MTLLTLIIINTLCILLAVYLCILIGAKISRRLPLSTFSSPYFKVGVDFYVGCTAFVGVWLMSSLIVKSVELSLYLTTALCILLLPYQTPRLPSASKKTLMVIVGVVLAVQAIGFSRALDPMPLYYVTQPELVDPFFGFGTVVHSFRAANITEFITEHDRFPVLGQHTFQGVLASLTAFSKFHSTQFSLIVWLNLFAAFSILLAYGFLRHFLNRYRALLATLAVALGNTLLSPFYTSITDTESALLRITNFEALFGTMTIFIAIAITYCIVTSPHRRLLYIPHLTFFVFGFIWNISSGHMIVVLSLVLLATIIYCYLRHYSLRAAFTLGFALCLGGVLGAVTLGGMFSKGNPVAIEKIPGMMSVIKEGQAPIALRFPRTSESGVRNPAEIRNIISALRPGTEPALAPIFESPTEIIAPAAPAVPPSLTQRVKNHPITFGAAKIVRSVQVVFFPLLGIFLGWYVLRKKLVPQAHTELFTYLTVVTSLTFLFGWCLSTVFTVYGYYWELSRFLYLGAFLSMTLLGLSTAFLYPTFGTLRKIGVLCVFIFVLMGPSLDLTLKSVGDLVLPPEVKPDVISLIPEENQRPLSKWERFEFLIDSNRTYGSQFFQLRTPIE
ncbi:hypothetical protein K2Q16_00335 [Patescibacteria group bacterium]|nr:hypothetical protein [Patescibacteria group bacterium]